MKKAYFAGGCFWCTEAQFEMLKGVIDVISGYSGGEVANPSYEDVCTGTTGHAECVEVTYDENIVSYKDLVELFMLSHDPTSLNRQGNDVGTQYRSAIFYTNEEEKKDIEEVISSLNSKGIFDKPIVTQVSELKNFYRAEEYHQDYFKNNPYAGYCQIVIAPKVAKFRKEFKERLQ